jgi:hypothetical protein
MIEWGGIVLLQDDKMVEKIRVEDNDIDNFVNSLTEESKNNLFSQLEKDVNECIVELDKEYEAEMNKREASFKRKIKK